MNNNGMIKYKESIIDKIKNFFKGIFKKPEENTVEIKKEVDDSFINEIKVDEKIVNSVIEKNNFLKEIEGNEEALNKLSIERLKKLEEYYDNIIKQNEQQIKKLKGLV